MYDASMFDRSKTIRDTRTFTPIAKGPHNSNIVKSAESNAKAKREHPSEAEKKMMETLTAWKIYYEFQKPMYIKSSGGFIKQYYIVCLFIPSRNIILEVYGRHFKKSAAQLAREKTLKKAFPLTARVEWYWEDFSSIEKLKMLRGLLGIRNI